MISKAYLGFIVVDGELDEGSTCKEFLQVQTEGTRQIKRNKKHYNFRMILAIGYRVRSNVGIHFRNWAWLVRLRKVLCLQERLIMAGEIKYEIINENNIPAAITKNAVIPICTTLLSNNFFIVSPTNHYKEYLTFCK